MIRCVDQIRSASRWDYGITSVGDSLSWNGSEWAPSRAGSSSDYPVVRSITQSSGDPSASIGVSMPAPVSAGDMLLVLVAINSNAAFTTPAGWIAVNSNSAIGRRVSLYTRVATGTEAGTVVVFPATAAVSYAAQCVRLAAGSCGALANVHVSGVDAPPRSPAIFPTTGRGKYLVITACARGADAQTTDSFPIMGEQTDTTVSGTVRLSNWSDEVSGATFTLGAFSTSGPVNWGAFTIAIKAASWRT